MEDKDKKNFLKSPPNKSDTFRKYWRIFIPQIVERKKFFKGHRELVIILCDLYTEYHKLTSFIEENGYSKVTVGRYGEQIKKWPEVEQHNFVIKEIRAIMKDLELKLSSENQPKDNGEKW